MTEPTNLRDHVKKVIDQALKDLSGYTDPRDRAIVASAALGACPDLAAGMKKQRHQAVQELRAGGLSHQDVADLLGLTRARAQQIAEGRTSGKRAKPPAEAEDSPAE
jgi:Spy/CpxP family protein refolding chaperone